MVTQRLTSMMNADRSHCSSLEESRAQLLDARGAVLRRFDGMGHRWRFAHLPGVVAVGSDRIQAIPSFSPATSDTP